MLFRSNIYMRRPAGLSDKYMPEVVSLRKCLYGLPMAPAKFREHSDKTLRAMGFVPTVSDPRLYKKVYPDGQISYILIHVDDLLVSAKSIAMIDDIFTELRKTYQITSSDDAEHYVGMYITRNWKEKSITVTQPGYIEELIDDYNVTCSTYPATPMVETPRLPSSSTNSLLSKKLIELYQSKVGSLLYLANQTRPDILFAVNMASRQTKAPTEADMVAVDRILQYVAGTPTMGLFFKSGEGVKLYATVDASYGNHSDRKSHTGCTLHIGLNSGAFVSRSKKQTVTADSSTVSEFIFLFIQQRRKSCGHAPFWLNWATRKNQLLSLRMINLQFI